MFSRYLYSKATGAKTRFISMYLIPDEIDFLKLHEIKFFEKTQGIYSVDCNQLKKLFCH